MVYLTDLVYEIRAILLGLWKLFISRIWEGYGVLSHGFGIRDLMGIGHYLKEASG